MASQEPASSNFRDSKSLYPQVLESNPESGSAFLSHPNNPSRSPLYPSLDDSPPPPRNPNANPSSSSSLYPSTEMKDLVDNLFPDADDEDPKNPAAAPFLPPPVEETLLRIPGAILHLIDKQCSVELGAGEFTVVRIRQGENTVAVLARIGDDLVQWPLARDEAAVKLDDSHYFFSLHVPKGAAAEAAADDGGSEDLLNYGLTFASKGQEGLLKELDRILESYSSFSVQKVEGKAKSEVLDGSVAKEVTPGEVMGPKKDMLEERSAAYWTTLAPNVEDYGGSVAKVIAKGSGQLIRGILWCGDVTVDRLKWGEDLLKRRMEPGSKQIEVSKDALKRIKRVKRVTKMSAKVASGVLSGVVKVSGFFTSSVVNSKAGKKFFSLLPGEIVLASLDGFEKICDAVEAAGKNVLQTSSVVTTGVVSHRYGEQAAEITNEGLDAAGHAIGTAWAVFKIRKALNPKSALKSTSLAKSAVKAAGADLKAKKAK
ncbi:protein EARLY-RESPONSIVE TO DEHYDRATION 7, chloroplastic-like [Phoenix dactylifera]|uniref:Protein EARLY-RESPONSIVE TO DEHYDRATION 7, chloroplastic-like n=1 Tax=Phoenix dactylifera TaxID=42345 RepID=A0A8B7BZC5_PHODC|nr:protein EARLY-RESPONSIVE TO DEHYDRATION 7, chloroplastic-like [Phoenix dactylifera]